MPEPRRALVTTGEAAREIGVGLTTLQRWAHAGVVQPAYRTHGGHFRWDLDDLRRQLKDEPAPAPEPPAQPDPEPEPPALSFRAPGFAAGPPVKPPVRRSKRADDGS